MRNFISSFDLFSLRHKKYNKFIERKGPSRELPQTRFLGDIETYAVNTMLSINRIYVLILEHHDRRRTEPAR